MRNHMRPKLDCIVIVAFLVLMAGVTRAESSRDWPRWRGGRDNGSNERGTYPVKWDSATNVLWKAPLPGKGCSTPIVWEQCIYVTAPVNGQDAVLAFDWSGKPLWTTKLGPERPGKNRNGSGCNSSPVTDGENIFVYFKSGRLAALDMAGKFGWENNLLGGYGKKTVYLGYGTSPAVTGKEVFIAVMPHG